MTEQAQAPSPAPPSRTCGECYACCVHLGIDALHKWPGQACKNLDGSLGACTRCRIYAERPTACMTFRCGWLNGVGKADQRPDKSGMLISAYAERIEGSGPGITIIVFDRAKAGTTIVGALHDAIEDFLLAGARDIAIVTGEAVLHFHNGSLRAGRLRGRHGPEELNFETYDPPIGTWTIKDKDQ